MAVYTKVSKDDFDRLLGDFDLGTCVALKGIDGGIENTNYFVTLEHNGEQTQYVLTLFEEFQYEQMPFFADLGRWLAKRGVPVPYAIADRNGQALKQLCGKPAFIQPRFHGTHVTHDTLTPAHCAAIGGALARFHLAGADFPEQREPHRGVSWWRSESKAVCERLDTEAAALLAAEVSRHDDWLASQPDLPSGITHGDLFHDNALFHDTEVDVILDIYNAATDYWLYDLAIIANDWCINADGSADAARERALIDGYAAVRPFTKNEIDAWPQLLRSAAMRFWLSRLIPWLGIAQAARGGSAEMKLKDPAELHRILKERIAHSGKLV